MPGLRSEAKLRSATLVGSVSYADGQFDDARFGIALAQTFAQQGGELINYAKAVAFARDSNGKLAALEVEDQLTGERFQIRAKVFVNCTGPFADQLRRMANPALPERLRLSKGVHLLLPLEALQSDAALLIPRTEDGRVIFAIPWLGRLLVGTTDDEANLTDEMVVTPAEVRYLLRHVNHYLNVNLTPQDVQSAFAGLRPLLKSKDLGEHREADPRPRSRGRCRQRPHQRPGRQVDHLPRHGGRRHRPRAAGAWGRAARSAGRWIFRSPARRASGWITGGSWRRSTICPRRPPGTWRRSSAPMRPRCWSWQSRSRSCCSRSSPGAARPSAPRWCMPSARRWRRPSKTFSLRRIGVQFHGWKEAAEAAPVVAQLLAREFAWSEAQTSDAVTAYLGDHSASAPQRRASRT